MNAAAQTWPPLQFASWAETYATLHRWTQIVGKVRMALTPPVNHWWHVPLYVTPRGLTTSAIPCGARTFAMTFDFVAHALLIECSDGATRTVPLAPKSVAGFHAEVMAALRALGIEAVIRAVPDEVEDRTPFDQDEAHASYDAEAASRFWRVLVQADRVLGAFRGCISASPARRTSSGAASIWR
jgi:hypothetical protein